MSQYTNILIKNWIALFPFKVNVSYLNTIYKNDNHSIIKFLHSEKATKFETIFKSYLRLLSNVKKIWRIILLCSRNAGTLVQYFVKNSRFVFMLKKIRIFCSKRNFNFIHKIRTKINCLSCLSVDIWYTNFIKSHEKCIEKKEIGKKCRKMVLKKLKEQSEQDFLSLV